jgi:hypothetical protein
MAARKMGMGARRQLDAEIHNQRPLLMPIAAVKTHIPA